MDELKKVVIYTDGCCLGNPGAGGYGVILRYNHHEKHFSGGFRLTTNNRMEIMAAIIGLSALKERCRVIIYSDSQYLVEAMTKGWVVRWKANHWWRNKDEQAMNFDLWERVLSLCEKHSVTFLWIKGHDGHPENEACDRLAKYAARQDGLPHDEGYYISD